MSIFKKKKPIGEFIIEPPKFDVPEVIKESNIKPTKCKRCLSTYQAKHKHIISELDYTQINSFIILTACPVCGQKNFVEFEEADDETKAD